MPTSTLLADMCRRTSSNRRNEFHELSEQQTICKLTYRPLAQGARCACCLQLHKQVMACFYSLSGSCKLLGTLSILWQQNS